MKKHTIILFALVLVSFACCKKEPNRQYSYWVVNNDSFSTNETQVTIGKAVSVIGINNITNSFSISFHYGFHLPVNYTFYLQKKGFSQLVDSAVVSFYVNNKFYIPALYNKAVLMASEINGKASYTLPEEWFINYDNPNDSVLIHGVFNEP